MARGAAHRLPHRLHRRARVRAAAAGRDSRRTSGTRCSNGCGPTAACPAGSGPATPCAPRWATRCTATSSRSTITPVQARTGWAVGWSKPAFWGRDVLLAERERGAARLLRGLLGARPRRPAARPARSARPTATRSASPRRAPSRPPCGRASGSRCSTARSARATRWSSTSAAGRCGAAWSSRRSCRPARLTPSPCSPS